MPSLVRGFHGPTKSRVFSSSTGVSVSLNAEMGFLVCDVRGRHVAHRDAGAGVGAAVGLLCLWTCLDVFTRSSNGDFGAKPCGELPTWVVLCIYADAVGFVCFSLQ